MLDIKFIKRDVLKEKPDQNNLGFGKYFTDYYSDAWGELLKRLRII